MYKNCLNCYHANCAKVNLRGFHMKKSWLCNKCFKYKNKIPLDDEEINRKRLKSDKNEIISVENTYYEIMDILKKLQDDNNEIKEKLQEVIDENKKLKVEIAALKTEKNQAHVDNKQKQEDKKVNKSYSSAVSNKILIVQPKEENMKTEEIKNDIRNNIDPADLGMGITMGGKTKKGGVILNCGNERNIKEVHAEVTNKMGGKYEIVQPKLLRRRIKIVDIHENLHENSDEDLAMKIIKQNNLDSNSQITVFYKSKIKSKKFTLIIESDNNTFKQILTRNKINIGFNRCWVREDYGIIRCYKCSKYGHVYTECRNENVVCPICSVNHNTRECKSVIKRCVNCVNANEKFNLNLQVDHEVWSTKCAVLTKIINSQKKKIVEDSL